MSSRSMAQLMQDTVRFIFGQPPDNVYKLADILPHRFGPHDLLTKEKQPLLLEKQRHCLAFTSGKGFCPSSSLQISEHI